ncbi:TetR/AcrR family transcriptional regulator [Bradyrhizobium genosp. P]|uniref:TetR/AcrR family transcriptional regulator n=1 Tax=Bradyrhizobium genosp. P TaxID=83641 RepID=UPI003CFB5441
MLTSPRVKLLPSVAPSVIPDGATEPVDKPGLAQFDLSRRLRPAAASFAGMRKKQQTLTNVEHREKSIEAVLSAAEFLFVTRGYVGTTTERIGELAGLTKGTVYFYFKTKEGVLLELLNRVRADVLVPYVQRLRDESLSPADRITAFLKYSGRIAAERPGAMLLPIVVSIEQAGTNSDAEKRVRAGYDRVALEVERVLDLGQASGVFRSDLSSKNLARLLIATNDGIMLECLRQNLRFQVDQLIHTLQAMILSGLSGSVLQAPFTEAVDGPSVLEVLKHRLSKNDA